MPKTYEVRLEISAMATMRVVANSEQEAADKAANNWERADLRNAEVTLDYAEEIERG